MGLAAALFGAATTLAQAPPGLSAEGGALLGRALNALGAGPAAGYTAGGTATLNSSRGEESGDITVEVWGAGHCRVTLNLSSPGDSRHYVAVVDGKRSRVTAPRELVDALAASGWRQGCTLLPQGLLLADLGSGAAAAKSGASEPVIELYRPHRGQASTPVAPVEVTLDRASALPASAAWSAPAPHGEATAIRVGYSDYQNAGGIQYPGQVVETVGGTPRLTIRFQSFAPKSGLNESDFALPAPPGPSPRDKHAQVSGGAR